MTTNRLPSHIHILYCWQYCLCMVRQPFSHGRALGSSCMRIPRIIQFIHNWNSWTASKSKIPKTPKTQTQNTYAKKITNNSQMKTSISLWDRVYRIAYHLLLFKKFVAVFADVGLKTKFIQAALVSCLSSLSALHSYWLANDDMQSALCCKISK